MPTEPSLSPQSPSLSPRCIGLVVPTRFEASPILRSLGFSRVAPRRYRLQENGLTVYLELSGIGPEAARQASYRLLDLGVKELVSVGYCGALLPELAVGDLVTDRVATSRTAVWGRAERQALADRAGAQAVDMETQAIVEAGTRRGVPIRILRVVSDRLGDDVSPLLGSQAAFSPLRIAFRLLNPANWPYAWRMWKQSRLASMRLVQAVRSYLGKD